MLGLCTRVDANFKSLSQRLPAGSNAIVAINVEKVLQTPYAKKEWLPTAADAWARQPVMIPPGAKRLLMASEVRTDSMEPFWEMSLIEMEKVPDLQVMAAKEGGHIDRDLGQGRRLPRRSTPTSSRSTPRRWPASPRPTARPSPSGCGRRRPAPKAT